MKHTGIYDVIVIGAGVMGSGAAYQLSRRGKRVLLVEQFEVGHALGSSHGPTRIIRLAYDIPDYVSLAQTAFEMWRALEAEIGRELMIPTGGIDVGMPDDPYMTGLRQTYEAMDVPYDALDNTALHARFDQFRWDKAEIGLFSNDYANLRADDCVRAQVDVAVAHGTVLHEHERVREVLPTAGGVVVTTDQGVYHAGALVLAAGSWMQPMAGALGVDLPLLVHKEQVAYFAMRNPSRYVPVTFPTALHHTPGTTSLGSIFPTIGHTGVKVMVDRIGPVVDPADPDRSIDAVNLDRLRAYVAAHLPDATGEILETASCRYTMTPGEDFVIDRHPAHPQIVLAAPCSGHGFKFGPVVGAILADLATRGETEYPVARFRLV
jgi:sarcosine oxidase